MSKVTSKLQVTLPKVIADRNGVGPGSDVVFEPAGESIRGDSPACLINMEFSSDHLSSTSRSG